MSFFDSDVVRKEMVEIQELQEEVYTKVFDFPFMDKEDRIEHVQMLEKLLDKQRVLYTRLSLSDDPEAKLMGMPENIDMSIVFSNMEKMLKTMRQQVDKDLP